MPGELVASDMFGPLRSPSIKGARYIIAYRDVATGFLWLDPVCRKDDLAESFARLIRDSPIPIRIDEADMQKRTIIQSDNDGPYHSLAFREQLRHFNCLFLSEILA
ncbi:uncharacterized protein MONBRDRAFT_13242 [Monosiga brevicollis MX1]|uniref:Integrase catalytic domain-containing protein n=1 Tax=Monosiga brevicollis TaxID=81824 RepID=A9VEP2_MONBE|nr:uncharacterized protein MONBRDRAFT_13242 [Monosiga brevicollis MX1]EDQ83999.1 predicted protein [Monosiga brevicollis MX1]|eukprot:XP_001751189.1 hypothetical protein [Monosiga brevicollis MX1]